LTLWDGLQVRMGIWPGKKTAIIVTRGFAPLATQLEKSKLVS